MDPIAELVRDLRETGKPSLAWIVRWSQDGMDPVAAAWEACEEPDSMRMLILGLDRLGLATNAAVNAVENDRSTFSNAKAYIVERRVDMENSNFVFKFHMDRKGKTYGCEITISAAVTRQRDGARIQDDATRQATRKLRLEALRPERLASLRAAMPVPPTLSELLTALQNR